MNSTVKTVLFWLLIGVSALLLWEVVKSGRDGQKEKKLSSPSSWRTSIRTMSTT